MTMTMNVILIPFFIDIVVMMEDHKTKSSRQVAILNRNFFFMLLNSLLLPLTGLTTIKSFIQALEEQDVMNWPSYFAKNLLTTYNYFITYFIQLTFLSVGFWLLDLPHQIVKWIGKTYHDYWEKKKRNPKPYVDTYAFDLGYHSAYSLTTFAIMLLFSVVVPYLPVIAGVFFVFKYNVDKYNLSFVYTSEFKGLGYIYKRTSPLQIFTIFLFQLINIGLFTAKTPSDYKEWYFWGGIGFVIFEVIVVLATSIFIKLRKRQAHWQSREKKPNMRNKPETQMVSVQKTTAQVSAGA